MKSILVILLVGSTAALVAAKCIPGGYCKVGINYFSELETLLDKVDTGTAITYSRTAIEGYRQVVKGFNYSIYAILYIASVSTGPEQPPLTVGYCVARIFKDLPVSEGGTGKITQIKQDQCYDDLAMTQKYLAKIVGVKEAA